jgi:TRAP-type C4-dicarboxylate transport system substrate-binding protein
VIEDIEHHAGLFDVRMEGWDTVSTNLQQNGIGQNGPMPKLHIRLGGYQPPRSILTRALTRIADALRRDPGVEVEFTPSITAAGRRADDLLTMTEGDELDICYFASSYLAERVPSLALLDRPYLVADRPSAHALLDGTGGRHMADDVARATGYRVLSFWDNGFRHISNGRRPIRTPADCRGLRIRTLNNALHQAFFRRLGFEPMFIDVSELVKAAADGAIDAQENPLTNVVNFELNRYHRHISLTGHVFGAAPLLVNRARFDAWPSEVRAAVEAAVAEATPVQRQEAAEEDEACHLQLVKAGVRILGPRDIDLAAFKSLAE